LVSERLMNAGVTHAQVQAIWYKNSNPANGTPVDVFDDSLLVQTKRAMHELYDRFPNGRLCYIASRIYAGHATGPLNPEPYAYRHGWVMKRIIEDQIDGDPQLQIGGSDANSPWLSWGAYLWADGTTPRSDGLVWSCPEDYSADGTHPSTIGRQKVAQLLIDHFTTDSTSCPWFLQNCQLITGVPSLPANALSIHYDLPAERLLLVHQLQGLVQVEILDASGRSVRNISSHERRLEIGTVDLRPGIYLVQCQDESGGVQRSRSLVAR
jgi:hypothetical protein